MVADAPDTERGGVAGMAEWVTVPDAARELGLPERTLRRYLDRHGGYVRTRRSSRSVLVAAEDLPVLGRIRQLYAAGRNEEEVAEALAAEFPRTVTVAVTDTRQAATPAEAFAALQAAVADMRREMAAAMAEQAEAIRQLRAEVEQARQEAAAAAEALRRLEAQEAERQRREEEMARRLEEALAELRQAAEARRRPWWRRWLGR